MKNFNTIHLWHIHKKTYRPEMIKQLTPIEQEKSRQFHFDKHREQFILTRAASQQILAAYLGIPSHELKFYVGPQGKPFLDHDTTLQFNLSHTEDVILCALTNGRAVGVDVEAVHHARPVLDIAKRFFTPTEYALLAALPETEQHLEFFKLWTLKEALAKATGQGLANSLNTIDISMAREKPMTINNQWQLQPLEMPEPYIGAIAYEGSPLTIEHYEYE